MANDSKTEKATPKKREDEQKKGNIFQSKDVVSAFSVLVLFYSLKFMLPFMYSWLSSFFTRFIEYIGTTDALTTAFAMNVLLDCIVAIFVTAGPLLLAAIAIGVIATGVQTKFKMARENIKPKFNRISPLQGLKRMFSLRSVIELVKSILKIIIIVAVLWSEFMSLTNHFATLLSVSVMQGILFILDSIMNIVLKLSMVFVAIAMADYLYQWWEYERNIRMSKQEIKEEYKQMEGDPQVKGQIKERQRKMSQQRMMQQVPTADVVVRNPTHFAVALKYDVEKYEAPVVVAKGQDFTALKIIEIAEANHVPLREDKPLARALYASVDVGREIPPEFYNAMAEIMAWVYTTKRKEAPPD